MNPDVETLAGIVGNIFAGVHGIELSDEERHAVAEEMIAERGIIGAFPPLVNLDSFNAAIEARGIFYDAVLGFVIFTPAE